MLEALLSVLLRACPERGHGETVDGSTVVGGSRQHPSRFW